MKIITLNRISLLISLHIVIVANAQIPVGYYDTAEGLVGEELREELKEIIDGHVSQSYSSLWTHFQSTDPKPNGDVWDMYSDVPGGTPDYTYTFVTDQCGNYGQEGDCYNREHSFPKSWFDDDPPMNTDIFHLVPTDGYVNSHRGNYPYGEVSSATWTSTNGSKKGPCSYPGYSGTVFEPIDEYKGDFARGYFYMLTRYMDEVDTWDSPMLDGNYFSDWALSLLLDWSAADTVSQKEIDRNNEIYLIQENRNPYIDHPEYIQLVWDLASSVEEIEFVSNLNYRTNSLYYHSNSTDIDALRIYSLSGQLLSTYSINSSDEVLPIYLNDGIYIIEMSGTGIRSSKKLAVFNQ